MPVNAKPLIAAQQPVASDVMMAKPLNKPGVVQPRPGAEIALTKEIAANKGGGGAAVGGAALNAQRAQMLKQVVSANKGGGPALAVKGAAAPQLAVAKGPALVAGAKPLATGPAAAAPAAGGAPAPAAAATAGGLTLPDIDWAQVGGFMGDMNTRIAEGLRALGGGGGAGGAVGGGGGGRVSFNMGGGGGAAPAAGGGMPDLASDQAELMKLDPKYQEQLAALGEEAKGMQGKLLDLDEAAQADLGKAKDAQLNRSRAVFNDKRDELLTRLFAGGTNQSTIAGDMGGRIVADQALVESDIEGQSADRALAMRQQLTDGARDTLALRAQMAQGQGDMALQELGINVDQLERGRDRQANMWEANLNAQTDLAAASMSASASAASAAAGLEADKFNSLVGLYGDMARNQENARQFDAGLSLDKDRLSLDRDRLTSDNTFRQKQLDLDHLNSDRDYDLGKRDIGVRRAAINAENNRFSQQLAFDKERYAGDSAFRDREFAEDTRRFDLGYQLDRDQFDLDKYRTEKEMYFRGKELKYGRRKAIVGSVGSIMGAFMSDERLKTEIRPIDVSDALSRLQGVEWVWKLGGEAGAGVLAQDVAEVLPEAVLRDEATGFLAVDYGYLVAVLLESHRNLMRRLEEFNGS